MAGCGFERSVSFSFINRSERIGSGWLRWFLIDLGCYLQPTRVYVIGCFLKPAFGLSI